MDDMDKIWYGLNQTELTIRKIWKYLTAEVRQINEDALLHIDLQAWVDKMEDSIYPISKNQYHPKKVSLIGKNIGHRNWRKSC